MGYPEPIEPLFKSNEFDDDFFNDGPAYYVVDGDYLYMRVADSLLTNGAYTEAVARLPYGATTPDVFIKTNNLTVEDLFIMGDYLYFASIDFDQALGRELYRVNLTGLVDAEEAPIVELVPSVIPSLSNTGIFILQDASNVDRASVFDFSGRRVAERNLSHGQTELDLSQLGTGLYVVQLYDDLGVPLGVQKINIQK